MVNRLCARLCTPRAPQWGQRRSVRCRARQWGSGGGQRPLVEPCAWCRDRGQGDPHVHLPRRFWTSIECSGVRSIREPSTGDWNVTPSSVISAKCSRET